MVNKIELSFTVPASELKATHDLLVGAAKSVAEARKLLRAGDAAGADAVLRLVILSIQDYMNTPHDFGDAPKRTGPRVSE